MIRPLFAKGTGEQTRGNKRRPHLVLTHRMKAFMTPAASLPLRMAGLAGLLTAALFAADSDADYRWRILPHLGGGDTINLTLTRRSGQGWSTSTNSVPLSSLHGLEPSDLWGGAVSFHIRRDAGTLQCKGTFVMGVGSGPVRFEPDLHFTADLTAMGISFEEDQLPELVFEDVRLSTIRDLRGGCACVRTMSDVLDLTHHGVDGRYLRQISQFEGSHLDIEEVTELKDHGVQSSLLDALKSGGYQLPVRAVVELQDHGVDPSFIRAMAPQFKGDGTAQNLISLHDHGISAEFVRSLQAAGVTPNVDQIIQLHDHGVEPKLVRAAGEAGLDSSPSAVISLHDHGIEPEYVKSMDAALHSKVQVNGIIALHDHGVSPEFAKQMAGSGFAIRDEHELIQLHEHGVPVELAAEVARSHRTGITTDDLVKLHDHGVDADFLRSFAAVGYATASVNELIELHDHGVTAGYAQHLQTEGFGVLPVSKLIQMKDHGV